MKKEVGSRRNAFRPKLQNLRVMESSTAVLILPRDSRVFSRVSVVNNDRPNRTVVRYETRHSKPYRTEISALSVN